MRIIWSLKRVNEPNRLYAYVASNYEGLVIYRDTAIRPPYYTYVFKFGSIEKPFKTLEEAKEAARDQVEDGRLQEIQDKVRGEINDLVCLLETAKSGLDLDPPYTAMIRERLSDALLKLHKLYAEMKGGIVEQSKNQFLTSKKP